MMFREKRAETASPVIENVIFIVLNIMFFAIMILFVVRSVSNAVVYEQAYAKEAALIIDSAKPSMVILMNIEDALKIAKSNSVKEEDIVRIDSAEKRIILKFSSKGAYSFQYFNDNEVSAGIRGIFLEINIKEKVQNV